MPNKPLKILVIDDDPTIATVLGRGLRRHQPTVETDPERAYRRLSDGEWFDVVVCDSRMPGRGGEQLLAASRAWPDPPIFVLMSGAEIIGDLAADVTLHKPFTVTRLLDLVAIVAHRRSCAITQPIAHVPPSSEQAP